MKFRRSGTLSEVKFYVHLRPVSLLSAARPGRDLNFFWNIYIFFLLFSSQNRSTELKLFKIS